jgi:tripartite motif-containing protein 71
VSDTWNHRVQKLDPSGKYLAQFPVVGWDSESVVEKPYLAVDGDGNIYFTDPEDAHVVKMAPGGQVLAVWGKQGVDRGSMNLPTGIAVASNGDVWIADSLNNRVLKFAAVK